MGVRITDLMDNYYDDTVLLPETDFPTAERTMELTMKKINRKERKKRRFPKGMLIAAILAVLLSITAGATYMINYQKTIELMETGPNTGGHIPVEIDEKTASVIEENSKYIGLTVTDMGATMTMDSVMGMSAEDLSVVYMTFTLTPPKGTVLTADIAECGFMEILVQPSSGESQGFGADGSITALDNGDGTISIMVMWIFRGDVSGIPYNIHLDGFGNMSKEVAAEIFSGAREIEVPGTWDFSLDEFPLEVPEVLTFDKSLFENASYCASEINISPFGGTIRFESGVMDNIYGVLPYQVIVEYPDGTIYESWTCYLNNGTLIFVFDAPQPVDEATNLIIENIKIPLNKT